MTQARRIVKLDPEDDVPTFHRRPSAAVAEYLGAEQDLVPPMRPSFLKRPEDLAELSRRIPRVVTKCHQAEAIPWKRWALSTDGLSVTLLEETLQCAACKREAGVEVVA